MLLLFLSSGLAHSGDKYRGFWGGEAGSSLEILSTKPIKINYCYLGQCGDYTGEGTLEEMKFVFKNNGSWPGAKMTLTKNTEGYFGVYITNGNPKRNEVQMRKQ
jgi:hypothetical protein